MAGRRNEIEVSKIPEVQEFVQARTALDEFMDQHADVFETYRDMVEHTNDARDRADKEVRAKGVSCGPWDLYQTATKYDAKALYEALGRDEFLRAGGKLSTITEYAVDKGKVDAAISRGVIPPDVASDVKKTSPRFKTPKDIGLP